MIDRRGPQNLSNSTEDSNHLESNRGLFTHEPNHLPQSGPGRLQDAARTHKKELVAPLANVRKMIRKIGSVIKFRRAR